MSEQENKISENEEKSEQGYIYKKKLTIHLTEDIFNFVLLSFNDGIFYTLDKAEKISLILLCLITLMVQGGGFVLIWICGKTLGISMMKDEFSAEITCDNSNVISNCDLYVPSSYYEPMTFETFADYFARFIAISMVVCFSSVNLTSLSRIPVVLLQVDSVRVKIWWFLLWCFQVFAIIVGVFRIVEMIIYSTAIVDVLSVGIGFIILLEVDEMMYRSARPLVKNDNIFQIEVNLKAQRTIYSHVKPIVWDIVVFISVWMAGLYGGIGGNLYINFYCDDMHCGFGWHMAGLIVVICIVGLVTSLPMLIMFYKSWCSRNN